MSEHIFVINTGSTSTKLALFEGGRELRRAEQSLTAENLKRAGSVNGQLPGRLAFARETLKKWRVNPASLDMISCRAGTLFHPRSGAYRVDSFMIDVLRWASKVPHASNLACMIGRALAEGTPVPVMVYDSVYTDEFPDIAKVSGLPEVTIFPGSHVLNSRAVARHWCEQQGKNYLESSFIVAHLGGGITVNAQRNGRILDAVFDDMGPMSPQRAGRIQSRDLVPMCYSGRYTQEELMRRLYRGGGLLAHCGTDDLRELEARIDAGDEHTALVCEAMAYQVSKAIGELAAVLAGDIDCIILTGGAAHSQRLTTWIRDRVSFLAPVAILPGEREMEALAAGALRVLRGEEPMQTYRGLPPEYVDESDFYQRGVPAGKGR